MKLQVKIVLIAVPLIVAPILLMGWFAHKQLQETAQARMLNSLTTLLDQIGQHVLTVLATAETNLELLAANPLLKNYLLTTNATERYQLIQPALLQVFVNYQKVYPAFQEIRVLLPNGQEDFRVRQTGIDSPEDVDGRADFIDRLNASPSDFYARVQPPAADGGATMLMARKLELADPSFDPVRATLELQGSLAVTVSLDFMAEQVREKRIGSEGIFFFTDAQGTVLFHPRAGEIGRQLPTVLFGALREAAHTDGISHSQRPGEAIWRAKQLRPNLLLIGMIPRGELAEVGRNLSYLVLLITLLAVVVATTSLLLVLRNLLVKPILILAATTKMIGEGHWPKMIPINNRDEIGDLAAAFMDMSGNLQNQQAQIEAFQRDLQDKANTAEAANRAKSEFLATMSHEIRTPLNGVLGMAELLSNTPLVAQQKQFVDTLQQSGHALLELINDILDFSKIEAGQMELEQIVFTPQAVVRETAMLLNQRARQKSLKLRAEWSSNIPDQVLGDPARLRQVLLNLAGNAVKFTESGEVVISVVAEELKPDKASLRFTVRDTGIGIAPEQQAGIFDAFAQADGSINRRYGGTGLGLAISQRLTRLMGGEMGLLSTLGEGSTFWVQLDLPCPATSDAVSSVTNARILPRFAAAVLVAEDNLINQEVARHMLEGLGCQVTVVSNGREVLESVEQANYDLILMDCHMPELDGFAATSALRRRESALGVSRTPIVALTANVVKGVREGCLAAGMDDYLSKPFSQAQLAAVLQRGLAVANANQGIVD